VKFKGLLIALGVLALLTAIIWWSNKKQESASKTPADTTPKILSLTQADIKGLSIRRGDQLQVELSRNQAGTWRIDAPKVLAADQDSVSSLLSTLSSLNSEKVLEEKPTDLTAYGLASPALVLDLAVKGNKTQKLLVGDQTPAGNSYYVVVAGDPRLFTLASFSKTSLDKSADDLRDKRLFTADFDKVSQIELRNYKPDKKQDFTFAREKDAWQILKPKPYRAESTQVEELIRTLREAKLDTSPGSDDAKIASAYKAATPLAAVKVTGAAGTQELELRKAKDDYFAKSSVLSGICKVPISLGTGLDKSLDDFRNKRLFDFGYQEPEKIEIHDGAKSYFLTRSGSDWWGPEGKKLDESLTESVVSKLRELTADKFPETGFASPSIQITVTSSSGKRLEKVAVAKSGDAYIAKRENEPEFYGLTASAMTDLLNAAAALKPAPEPKK
jgi:uncharacterized protein DUF4340